MTSRFKFVVVEDDCDAWEDYRARLEADRWQRRDALYRLLREARQHFPGSKHLRRGWVRARLMLGNKKPKVRIGVGLGAAPRFARTMREAVFL